MFAVKRLDECLVGISRYGHSGLSVEGRLSVKSQSQFPGLFRLWCSKSRRVAVWRGSGKPLARRITRGNELKSRVRRKSRITRLILSLNLSDIDSSAHSRTFESRHEHCDIDIEASGYRAYACLPRQSPSDDEFLIDVWSRSAPQFLY